MRISDWSSDVCSSDLLDQTVVFEFLIGLYDKWLGRIIPTRFALFGTVGAMGVVVQLAALWIMLHVVFRERFVYGNWSESATFNVANTFAAVVAKIGRAACRERVCQ